MRRPNNAIQKADGTLLEDLFHGSRGVIQPIDGSFFPPFRDLSFYCSNRRSFVIWSIKTSGHASNQGESLIDAVK
ncbi:hypothetical protein Sjap_001481 [Stephania japonica]|uniref:Uncharacterized protein n=1 Tax=Stephania japonica TaxID=461633 RepID=A0AAP0PV31_9MAGN